MKAELEKLIALQNSDTNIKKLKHSLNTVNERRGRLEQEFKARASEILEMQQRRDHANSEKNKLEAQIAEIRTHLDRAERNLKASQNQKQYEAAIREKASLEKQVGELETQLTDKMIVVEEAEKVLSERSEEISKMESEREQTMQNFETETAQQKIDLEAETKRRAEVFETLPKNLAAIYNRLSTRIRDGVAVAQVKNGACSACFMSLRPQMLVDVKKGDKIMTCESCNRILYYQPTEKAEALGK